nr:hypothetical protein [[Eubacterium] tenue]
MLDVFDIIDLDLESVIEYKKYLVQRYFYMLSNDIKPYGKCIRENDMKYLEVCSCNKPLDYYEITDNFPNITLCELDKPDLEPFKIKFIKLNFDTKEDIKKYIDKVNGFVNTNISTDFLDGIARIQYKNDKTRIFMDNTKKINKNGQLKKDFLDRASKYVIALSLKYEIQWESILYKRYFELDNK